MTDKFIEAMQQAGIAPPSNIQADGDLHRFHIEGDKPRSKNGWYVLHDNPPAGAFGSWKLNVSETWNSKAYTTFTDAEKAQCRANMEAVKRQREEVQQRVHAECREKSEAIWKKSHSASKEHSYTLKKGLKDSYGVRKYRGSLVVPVRDGKGTLHGLQFILPEKDEAGLDKYFVTGTNKKGHYHSIGGKPESVLYLAEGYATAATIHEATGEPVAVCFDAGNLKPVAEVLRSKLPDMKIVICADDDKDLDDNPGLTKGSEAAAKIGGLLAVPVFLDGVTGTDFNDLAAAVGLDEVKRQIESATKPTLATLAGLATDKEPLPLLRSLPKSEPFPLETLPPVLKGMATQIIQTIQPPSALAGQSILAAASLAVQSLGDISIDGRSYPLSCYFVTVGESGERKTAVDNAVLAPHRKHERTLIDKAKDGQLDYLAELEAWKKAKEQILKKSEDIKYSLIDLGPEPAPPLEGQIITEEPTYEGLIKLLEVGQSSIGIFSAEGGRFLGGHAMSKENQLKTVTGLSSLWDHGCATRTRSSDGSKVLYGRRCSLHLMLQPNIARDLFGNSLLIGQGILSRCLATYPESNIGNRPYREADLSQCPESRAYFSTMMQLLEWPQPLAEGQRNELSPKEMYLSPEAKNEWIQYHDHVERLMQEGRELSSVRGFAAKAAEHAARLAGILTLVEDPATNTINQHAIQSGIELSQFYIGEALRLFHASNDDQELILAEQCLNWAISRGGLFSVPCLYQKGPNKVRNKKTANQIVEILQQHNQIEVVAGGAEIDGRKRRDVWRVAV